MEQDEHDFPGRCTKCGVPRQYSGRFDAAFCPVEDEWQESPCGDRSCRYCSARPARPSDAADLAVELLDE